MPEEKMIQDSLFGGKGIDTKYERSLIYYRPLLSYLREYQPLMPEVEVNQDIERAERFPVYQIVYDYNELLDEIENMFILIRNKVAKEKIDEIEMHFKNKSYNKIFDFENSVENINQYNYLEYYTMGLFIKESIQFRLDEVIDKYVKQYTDEVDPEKIKEAEEVSIEEWKQLEQKSMSIEEDYEKGLISVSSSDEYAYDDVLAELVNDLETMKQDKYDLHTTLADLGYIHRNRYFMMLHIIDSLYSLVESIQSLVPNDIENLIYAFDKNKSKLNSIKAHLLIQYKNAKEQHSLAKGQYTNYVSKKETLANDKQYFYQQVVNNTKNDLMDFVYANINDESDSVQMMNEIIVGSMVESNDNYNNVLAEIFNFYKEEANFYQEMLLKIQAKEKIKVLYRIIEDIGEVSVLTKEWIANYVETLNSTE